MTLVWLTAAALLAAVEAPVVPADLAGQVSGLERLWVLPGVAPGGTVLAYDSDRGPELLVGGPRANLGPVRAEAPLLGDLALVSPDGFARRRIASPDGLAGLPAMVGRVALGCSPSGQLTLWSLSRAGLESTPRRLDGDGASLVGPVSLGRTTLFAAGRQVRAVSDLFEERWHADLDGAVSVPLATDSQRAFCATRAQLSALDLVTGRPAWRLPLPAAPQTALVVAAGAVVAGLADGSVRAWDVDDGSPIWQRDLAPAVFAPLPAAAGPWLFFTCADGRLLALDADDGSVTWQAQRGGPLSSPVVGRGHVFVTTGDGVVAGVPLDGLAPGLTAACTTADGAPARLAGVPCLFGDRLYVVSDEGLLAAYRLVGAAGAVDWPVPGGTARRCGRSLPAEDLPAPVGPRPGPAPDDDTDSGN